MGRIDRIRSSSIEMVDDETRSSTTNLMISIVLIGFSLLLAGQIGLVPDRIVEWGVITSILVLMFMNPLAEFPSLWGPFSIFGMFFLFIGWIIVYQDDYTEEILLTSLIVMMIVLLLEYPRRFGINVSDGD